MLRTDKGFFFNTYKTASSGGQRDYSPLLPGGADQGGGVRKYGSNLET
jgi:hypothetical protein